MNYHAHRSLCQTTFLQHHVGSAAHQLEYRRYAIAPRRCCKVSNTLLSLSVQLSVLTLEILR
jgi:hypothetical protein